MDKKVTGILLVAGNSTRYGKNKNKNFELVHGKSILSYSLDVFSNHKEISDIILVIRPEDSEEIEKILKFGHYEKKIKIVYGGASRMESVYHALCECSSKYVVIHDGARPVIKESYIDKILSFMDEYKGCVVGVKVKDTIKIVNDAGEVLSTTNREQTYISQTPQCFERKVLTSLHEKYKEEKGITDDAMLLEKGGYSVKMVEGDYSNIKVTTPEDLQVVLQFL